MVRRSTTSEPPVSHPLRAEVRRLARPLRSPADLGPLIERVKGVRVVLLGEASHGTHEYYAWRAEITRRLVADHGFAFVAVEGHWPDCYAVNRFVKGQPGAPAAPAAFGRWPTWIWANAEVENLVGWLRNHNAGRPAGGSGSTDSTCTASGTRSAR